MSFETLDLTKFSDPVTSDPSILDPEFPPEQFVTHFISQGSVVHATVWIARGSELKGTVILSPQWFGGDRLESVIIPLQVAGINVMTFHPRGMWDNQHIYTLATAADDLLAAAAYVRSTSTGDAKTGQGKLWRTDPQRIAVMGLSGGGANVSIFACATDPLIQSVIAVAANSMAVAQSPEKISGTPFHDRVKELTAGRVDVLKTLASMNPAELDRVRPIVQAPRLVDKNVLLIGALNDRVATIETCHKPIAQAFRDAGVRVFDDVILDTDHSFLTKRIALARLIIGWLRQRCDF
ncbi:hypothetical protein WG907_17180 [Sphingobium sp. AN558]|uniref:alpha/beta hydrolase family protein n=1 Tax=Sphingobium sp. AN558 TaxID=3133442 RepID=UPI0030BF6A9B